MAYRRGKLYSHLLLKRSSLQRDVGYDEEHFDISMISLPEVCERSTGTVITNCGTFSQPPAMWSISSSCNYNVKLIVVPNAMTSSYTSHRSTLVYHSCPVSLNALTGTKLRSDEVSSSHVRGSAMWVAPSNQPLTFAVSSNKPTTVASRANNVPQSPALIHSTLTVWRS